MRFLRILWPVLRNEFKSNIVRKEWSFFRTDIYRHVSIHIGNASQLNSEDENKTSSSVTTDEELIKSMKDVFPLPRYTIKNFYSLLSQNKNKKCSCEYKFKSSGPMHQPTFSCTLRLSGPIEREFCGHGKNKKSAEAAASLKALACLRKEKKIDYEGKPRELAQAKRNNQVGKRDEIRNLLYKKMSFTFPENLLSKVEEFISEYKSELSPIVMSGNDEEDLMEEEQEEEEYCDPDSEPWIVDLVTGRRSSSFTPESDYARDAKLRRRLANREEKGFKHTYPIDDFREAILEAVDQHPVTIIEGGTGCGKSTQVPQMLLDDWTKSEERGGSRCNVVVAQPRRIATISLAHWVAKERREKLGDCIGYKMRLDEHLLKKNGGIVFYTSGSLREMLRQNPRLEGVSHVIIDEVHERFIDTDLLLLMLKRAQAEGSDLKLILMSATARVEEFKSYFDTESVISVQSGTSYPVTSHYIGDVIDQIYREGEGRKKAKVLEALQLKGSGVAPSPVVDHDMVCRLVEVIDQTKPHGAVLVFLPGWNDINMLEKRLSSNPDLMVLPLHSRLPRHAQNRVFGQDDDGGRRKVILSTNIAETSLTIEDVVYIIDTGLQNDNRYIPKKNQSTFGTVWIAKANAVQRMGRAGRVQPGEVYRLYDEETFERMDEFPKPEMLRLPLESVVLKCKSLFESSDVRSLLMELIESPSAMAVEKAVESLVHLRILRFHSRDNYTEILTPLGRFLSAISTTPAFSKALVYSAFLGNADYALNFVALENKWTSIFKYSLHNTGLKMLKEKHASTSDLLAVSRFLGHTFTASQEDEKRLNDSSWDQNENEDQDLRSRTYVDLPPERNRSFDLEFMEDTNCMLESVSQERLVNVIKIKKLFQRQLNKWILSFIESTSNKPVTEVYQSNESTDPDQNEDQYLFEGDFVLDDVDLKTPCVECDADLVLASFLASSSSVVKQLSFKNEEKQDSFKTPRLVAEDGTKVMIHKSSVLCDKDFSQHLHDQLFFSTDIYYSQDRNVCVARDLSAVPPTAVALFYGQELDLIEDDESTSIYQIRGTKVCFGLDQRTGSCIFELRKIWHQILDYHLKKHSHHYRREDSSDEEEEQKERRVLEFTLRLNQLINVLLKQK